VSSEAYFYILEAAPMVLALLCFVIKPPGAVLVGPESELPGLFATVKIMYRRRKGVEKMEDEQELRPWSDSTHLK